MGLSLWQVKRQLAYLASVAAFEESPQGLVFSGGAFVSEDLEGNFKLGAVDIDGPVPKWGTDNAVGVTPFCRVQLLRADWDRRANHSRIERALLRMWSTAGGGGPPGAVSTTGFDSHGINMVTGANRAAVDGQGQAQGRDVDELIGRFVETYGGHFIDSTHGFQGRCQAVDTMRHVDGSRILKRALEVEVFNALQSNYYHPGRNISAAVSGEYHQFFLSSGNLNPGDLFRVHVDGVDYDFVAGTDFAIAGGGVNGTATNLKNAINVADIGVTASSATQFVTVTRTTGSGVVISVTAPGSFATNNNGTVLIQWTLPPTRFDTLRGVLQRGTNAGDPAPATVNDGVNVPIGDLDTSVFDGYPGAGEWNYSYFMGYAETDGARTNDTPDRYSDPVSASVTL